MQQLSFWQGDKFENGSTWTWSDEGDQNVEHKNIKTFGFYDNNEITPSDYKAIDYEMMEDRLTSAIMLEIDDRSYEIEITNQIQSYKNQCHTVYQFLPDKLEKSKFSAYSHFIAFILMDNALKKAIRIEFAQD